MSQHKGISSFHGLHVTQDAIGGVLFKLPATKAGVLELKPGGVMPTALQECMARCSTLLEVTHAQHKEMSPKFGSVMKSERALFG